MAAADSAAPVCIVVGMGDSLGAALVRRFATGGGKVAFTGRRAAALAEHEARLRADGYDVRGFAADAADRDAMADVVARITQTWGHPEVLIYNAAVMQQGELGLAELADARLSFEANALGALNAAQLVRPGMRQAGGGTILISGGAAAIAPHPGWGILALGKAALRSITLSLAHELKPDGIRVSSVVIYGSIQYDPFYAPDAIAQRFWELYQTPGTELPAEVDFRP